MRTDAYVAGFFLGCLFLCGLMLAIPKPTKCEVSVYKQGSRVEVVQVGVISKFSCFASRTPMKLLGGRCT